MQMPSKTVDRTKVKTVIFHLPDGQAYQVSVDGMEHFIEFGLGKICDTSDIDGIVHYFPRGNS